MVNKVSFSIAGMGHGQKHSFSMPGKGLTNWTEPTKMYQTGRRRRRRRRRFVVPRPGAKVAPGKNEKITEL
jgi:hypothetical protein